MLIFSLGRLFYVTILIVNAIAVLSEDRFLARIGWGRTQQADPAFGAASHAHDSSSVKARTIEVIAGVRTVMRIPLIAINTLIIVYELILG